MQAFSRRKYLARQHSLSYRSDGGWPYLEVDSPLILARFSAVIRQAVFAKYPQAQAYCRGQDKHFGCMAPSLFRVPNERYSIPSLLKAEADFVVELKKASSAKRFRRPDVSALLQHYGVRTSWLDVVDNLYVAVWFATHSRQDKTWAELPSCNSASCRSHPNPHACPQRRM
jgi:hypothetical protein